MSKLAILGGKPTRAEPYPAWPVHDERDVSAVTAVIRSGHWGGYPYPRPQTAEFARRFAEMQGGGYAVVMVNGTVTMEVALRAANVGWGDEVIVPAYTFQATAAAPMSAGAIPVMVDIDPQTYCMDPKQVEAAITPRTKAFIPVHVAAQMADMDAIMDIAERHDLIVIEDAAHAHGAKWRERGAGTIGHFGSFSLQSSKILTTGEGGVLLRRQFGSAAQHHRLWPPARRSWASVHPGRELSPARVAGCSGQRGHRAFPGTSPAARGSGGLPGGESERDPRPALAQA